MPRLYEDLAFLWPLLSPPEDYEAEAEQIRLVIKTHLSADTRGRILEFGAGGGHTLCHLTAEFDATAVDLSDSMLENSRRLNPDVNHVVGDMRSLRLDQTFDAALIHDAIDYMLSEDDLRATFQTASAHLNSGGVLIVAPTYIRENFVDHQSESDCFWSGDQTGEPVNGVSDLAYASYVHDPDPDDSGFRLYMMITYRMDRRLHCIEDVHECGLFTTDTWIDLIRGAGFELMPTQTDGPFVCFVALKK